MSQVLELAEPSAPSEDRSTATREALASALEQVLNGLAEFMYQHQGLCCDYKNDHDTFAKVGLAAAMIRFGDLGKRGASEGRLPTDAELAMLGYDADAGQCHVLLGWMRQLNGVRVMAERMGTHHADDTADAISALCETIGYQVAHAYSFPDEVDSHRAPAVRTICDTADTFECAGVLLSVGDRAHYGGKSVKVVAGTARQVVVETDRGGLHELEWMDLMLPVSGLGPRPELVGGPDRIGM